MVEVGIQEKCCLCEAEEFGLVITYLLVNPNYAIPPSSTHQTLSFEYRVSIMVWNGGSSLFFSPISSKNLTYKLDNFSFQNTRD